MWVSVPWAPIQCSTTRPHKGRVVRTCETTTESLKHSRVGEASMEERVLLILHVGSRRTGKPNRQQTDWSGGRLCGSGRSDQEGGVRGNFLGPCSASFRVWVTQARGLSRLVNGTLTGCHRGRARRKASAVITCRRKGGSHLSDRLSQPDEQEEARRREGQGDRSRGSEVGPVE